MVVNADNVPDVVIVGNAMTVPDNMMVTSAAKKESTGCFIVVTFRLKKVTDNLRES